MTELGRQGKDLFGEVILLDPGQKLIGKGDEAFFFADARQVTSIYCVKKGECDHTDFFMESEESDLRKGPACEIPPWIPLPF